MGTGYNSLRRGRTNVFCRSNRQRQRKAVLAQSGERQRSGKRRLREGKRTAANRRSALRKCRNAVSAGVLSPISSAAGRNGAVGDKESARAGARNYPRRRQIMRLRRCAATPHPPPSGAPSPQGEGLGLCGPGTRLPVTSSGGRFGGGGGRSKKRLPWLGQAAAEASAPVNAGTVLLSDNDDERLCP